MAIEFVGTPTSASNASGTAITLATPTGLAVGDVLVAALRTQSATVTADYTSSGWIRASADFVASQGTARGMGLYYRPIPNQAALDALPTSFTFTRTDTATTTARQSGAMRALRGVDLTDPIGGRAASYIGSAITNGKRIELFELDTGVAEQLYVAVFASEFTANISTTPTTLESGFASVMEGVTAGAVTTTRTGVEVYAKKVTAAQTVSATWSASMTAIGAQGVVFNGKPDVVTPPATVEAAVVASGGTLIDYELWAWNGTNGDALDGLTRVEPALSTVTELLAKMTTTPVVIAHRGGSVNFPEMSLHAYTQSLIRGVDALEFSVGRTSDGKYIGLHDADLNRTSATTGLPAVSSMTWAQVQQYLIRASITDDPTQPDRPYPLLFDVLDAYPGAVFFLDPKYLGSAGAIALFQYLKDNYPNATDRFMLKYYFTATTIAGPVSAMGFRSWGYLYDADLANANFSALAAAWTILGFDYLAPTASWVDFQGRMSALGKRYLGHIAPNLAATTRPLANGASGNMVSGVRQVKGF